MLSLGVYGCFVLFNPVRPRARKRFLKPLNLTPSATKQPTGLHTVVLGSPWVISHTENYTVIIPPEANPHLRQDANDARDRRQMSQEDPLKSLSPGHRALQAGEKRQRAEAQRR